MWLAKGHIAPVLHTAATAFPATVETLFAAVMAIGNVRAPGFLTVVFLLLALGFVGGLARRIGLEEPFRSLAVLLVAASPVVEDQVGVAFVDIAFAAFALAAVSVMLEPIDLRAVVVAGALVGFAAGTKYTGLVLLAAIVVSSFVARDGRSWRSVLFGTVAGAAVAMAVMSPWYIRNYVVLGSPIYPPPAPLDRWFHVRAMSQEAVKSFSNYISDWNGRGHMKGVSDLVLLPLRLTFHPTSFGAWNGAFGPALLAFVPAGLLHLRGNVIVRRLAVWAVVLVVAWFYTEQERRFLIHVVAAATVIAVAGIRWYWTGCGRLGRAIVAAVVSVTVLIGSATIYAQHENRFGDVLFRSPSLAQRAGRDGPAIDWLNHTSDVRKVLVVDACVKPFYLDKPYFMVRGEYGEQPDADVPDVATAVARQDLIHWTYVLDVSCEDPALDGRFAPLPSLTKVFDDGYARIYTRSPVAKTFGGSQ